MQAHTHTHTYTHTHTHVTQDASLSIQAMLTNHFTHGGCYPKYVVQSATETLHNIAGCEFLNIPQTHYWAYHTLLFFTSLTLVSLVATQQLFKKRREPGRT